MYCKLLTILNFVFLFQEEWKQVIHIDTMDLMEDVFQRSPVTNINTTVDVIDSSDLTPIRTVRDSRSKLNRNYISESIIRTFE